MTRHGSAEENAEQLCSRKYNSHTEARQCDFEVEFDREEDGRWIAEIASLPGAMAYGETKDRAMAAVEAIAFALSARLACP